MADKKNFLAVIDAETKTETYDVKLGGVEYTLYPPKSSLAMHLAQAGLRVQKAKKPKEKAEANLKAVDAMIEWVTYAFDKKEADAIQARLNDPKDSLDLEHISKLNEIVMKKLAPENPTG